MLVLHQNRAAHNRTDFIPEHFIEGFFNLVMWGHEHECRITPGRATKSFFLSAFRKRILVSLEGIFFLKDLFYLFTLYPDYKKLIEWSW